MKRISLAVGGVAVVAAAALPLTATAATAKHPNGRALHRVVRLDRKVIRLDRRVIKVARQRATGEAFAGAVTLASSGSVTLDVLVTGQHDTQLKGTSVTVAIDSATKIVYGKGQTSIDSGDLVNVRAATSGSTLTATQIHVDCNCHFAAGTVSSVSTGSFVLHVLRTGPFDRVLKGNDVTIQTPTAVSGLAAGANVGVIFSATGFFRDPTFDWTKATFTAKQVRIRTAQS
jgi:hypothetical protein